MKETIKGNERNNKEGTKQMKRKWKGMKNNKGEQDKQKGIKKNKR